MDRLEATMHRPTDTKQTDEDVKRQTKKFLRWGKRGLSLQKITLNHQRLKIRYFPLTHPDT